MLQCCANSVCILMFCVAYHRLTLTLCEECRWHEVINPSEILQSFFMVFSLRDHDCLSESLIRWSWVCPNYHALVFQTSPLCLLRLRRHAGRKSSRSATHSVKAHLSKSSKGLMSSSQTKSQQSLIRQCCEIAFNYFPAVSGSLKI